MPPLIEIPIPLRVDKLTEIVRIRGVSVYIHWSVFLIAVIMLMGVLKQPLVTLAAFVSYFTLLLLHECGHLIAAQRLRCQVFDIRLYPVFGITHFEIPWSRFDHCVIAWAGVLAQAAVALPIVIWVATFGYTPFGPINAVLAILGFISLGVAAFNLLPIPPLDGATAWSLIPESIKKLRNRRSKRAGGWR